MFLAGIIIATNPGCYYNRIVIRIQSKYIRWDFNRSVFGAETKKYKYVFHTRTTSSLSLDSLCEMTEIYLNSSDWFFKLKNYINTYECVSAYICRARKKRITDQDGKTSALGPKKVRHPSCVLT